MPPEHPGHPGAQSFPGPENDELIKEAVQNFLSVLSPNQVKMLSDRVVESHREYGEMHLVWRGQIPYTLLIRSDKLTL